MRKGSVWLVCCGGKLLDRIRVREYLGVNHCASVVSLEKEPGTEIMLEAVEGGWARSFPDPMTSAPVHGTRVPPLQLIETNHS